MIYGFEIELPDGGTNYGVVTSNQPDIETRLMIAEANGVSIFDVALVNAEDLIKEQYQGLAYFSTDNGL